MIKMLGVGLGVIIGCLLFIFLINNCVWFQYLVIGILILWIAVLIGGIVWILTHEEWSDKEQRYIGTKFWKQRGE